MTNLSKAKDQVTDSWRSKLSPAQRAWEDLKDDHCDWLDWFDYFVCQEFGAGISVSYGGGPVEYRLQNEPSFSIDFTHSPQPKLTITTPDPRFRSLPKLLESARLASTTGQPVPRHWWTVSVSPVTPVTRFLNGPIENLLRKVAPGIYTIGKSCIGQVVEASCDEGGVHSGIRFVNLYFRSNGRVSPKANREAVKAAHDAYQILALWLGMGFAGTLIPHCLEDVELREVMAKHDQTYRGEPAIDGKKFLESLLAIIALGGEVAERVRNSLSALHYSEHQPTLEAAIVFSVIAIEALSVPNAAWSKERSVRRFVDFMEHFQDAARALMADAAFLDVFPRQPSVKALANYLYQLRSKPVHTGSFGLTAQLDSGIIRGQAQYAVFEFVRRILIEFSTSPWTPLTGHPAMHRNLALMLSPSAHLYVCQRAAEQRISITGLVESLLESYSGRATAPDSTKGRLMREKRRTAKGKVRTK